MCELTVLTLFVGDFFAGFLLVLAGALFFPGGMRVLLYLKAA
jgi:hypothetical protein